MPSVYLWNVCEDFDGRVYTLSKRLERLHREIESRNKFLIQSSSSSYQSSMTTHGNHHGGGIGGGGPLTRKSHVVEDLSLAVQNQVESLLRMAGVISKLHEQMDGLRCAYKDRLIMERFHSGGAAAGGNGAGNRGFNGQIASHHNTNSSGLDPFEEADAHERDKERRLEIEVRNKAIAASETVGVAQAQAQAQAQAATGIGAPAPAGGLFGSTAPAPAAGGLFGGGAAAPAPATGGLFGAPAPAPASTSTTRTRRKSGSRRR
mmetsp:Transcript_23493/g.26768  ORF Transcript_23493/g.26768 Transcript_23493/m.26768 type:complete len:262 (-) Transcript_23493:106-891(-)